MKKDNQMIGELNILFLVPTYLLIVLGHYMYPNYSVSQTHKSILNLFCWSPKCAQSKEHPFFSHTAYFYLITTQGWGPLMRSNTTQSSTSKKCT